MSRDELEMSRDHEGGLTRHAPLRRRLSQLVFFTTTLGCPLGWLALLATRSLAALSRGRRRQLARWSELLYAWSTHEVLAAGPSHSTLDLGSASAGVCGRARLG